MLHLWDYGTRRALGKARMGVFHRSLLSPSGIHSSAKISDQGLSPGMEWGQKTWLLDEVFRRDLEKLERRELRQRNRNVQQGDLLGNEERGNI